MSIWNVEFKYSINVPVEVEAHSYLEAIEKARNEVEEFKSEYIDVREVHFDDLEYVSDQK